MGVGLGILRKFENCLCYIKERNMHFDIKLNDLMKKVLPFLNRAIGYHHNNVHREFYSFNKLHVIKITLLGWFFFSGQKLVIKRTNINQFFAHNVLSMENVVIKLQRIL